ncbi:peptidoglycan-associated lipoprotein Pal [Edaphobacter bradus]|uniref:peptidoglycan-associated lipoprotein Pal n=1 Tax=Edaphobacter bradus TaxID=2259016 RepID=UPI0021E0C591|nr:peptidoglycan-associated lipoprotein Pal [Edaphobacter bradus]
MKVHRLKLRSAAFLFATTLVLSGCHKKVASAPLAPPPPPPPAATAHIMVSPSAIEQGGSSTLTWTTTNATQVSITGLGTVPPNGSRTVTPASSTDYTLTATGASGVPVQAVTRITVTPPPARAAAPPSSTDEELFAQNIRDTYFDYDKYDLRPADKSTTVQDASFMKSHPGWKILIEGHCDDRGSAEYNISLGDNRAQSLRKALTDDGVEASRIRVISYGKEKPFCTDDNEECWQKNRRDHLKLDR